MRSYNRIDLTGRVFGDLTVIRHSHTARGRAFWVCNCDCGWMGVIVEGNVMRKGQKKACGIEGHRWYPEGYLKTETLAYRSWTSMNDRCYRAKNTRFSDYGGRGIKVCDRWRFSFANFFADMGERPGKEFTIERKEVDGDYEPNNCIWLPKGKQILNTRRTIYVDYQGRKTTLNDLCAELGLDRHLVYARLKQHNWPLERAISESRHRYTKRGNYRKSPKNLPPASAIIDKPDTALTPPDQDTIST